jgi:AcrR family transcriptional regulator
VGRPVNANGRQTREAVLEAALELFSDRGYFGTSLRDIATAVGVRESALYNYFPSKAHLFDAIMITGVEQRAEQLNAHFDAPISDVRVTLTRLATESLDYYCTRQQVQRFRMLMADGLRLARDGRINLVDRMSAGQARMRTLMRRLTKEGWLRRADPDALAMAFFGPLLWWRHLHAAASDHPAVANRSAFVRAHVDQFLHGADAPGARRSVRRTAVRPLASASRPHATLRSRRGR